MTDTTPTQSFAERTRGVIGRMAPVAPESVRDEQRLIEDLGFDSIRLMELTVALEIVFGLPRHNPQQLADVLRVGDVVDLVARESSGAGANR